MKRSPGRSRSSTSGAAAIPRPRFQYWRLRSQRQLAPSGGTPVLVARAGVRTPGAPQPSAERAGRSRRAGPCWDLSIAGTVAARATEPMDIARRAVRRRATVPVGPQPPRFADCDLPDARVRALEPADRTVGGGPVRVPAQWHCWHADSATTRTRFGSLQQRSPSDAGGEQRMVQPALAGCRRGDVPRGRDREVMAFSKCAPASMTAVVSVLTPALRRLVQRLIRGSRLGSAKAEYLRRKPACFPD